MKRVVIIGGGFAGVRTAVALSRARMRDLHITLISDKSHFDYYPSMFHLLNGHNTTQLAIPLDYIFDKTGVVIEKDVVTHVDFASRLVCAGDNCMLRYDYLVIAPGSLPNYYDLVDLSDHLRTITNIDHVLTLRREIYELVTKGCFMGDTTRCGGEILVVGAGPTGVEAAAEIALWARVIAREYQVPASATKVRLISSSDRIVPMFPEAVSHVLARKLKDLDVVVDYNRRLSHDEVRESVPDIQAGKKIIVCATGARLSPLIQSLNLDKDVKSGKLTVNEYLQVMQGGKSFAQVYAGGDVASTKYSGLAQTAMRDGGSIAGAIVAAEKGGKLTPYHPLHKGYVIAMGARWAIVILPWLSFASWFGFIVRMFVDFKTYIWLLPWDKAVLTYMSGNERWSEFETVQKHRMEEKYHRNNNNSNNNNSGNETRYKKV